MYMMFLDHDKPFTKSQMYYLIRRQCSELKQLHTVKYAGILGIEIRNCTGGCPYHSQSCSNKNANMCNNQTLKYHTNFPGIE